MIIAIEGIDKAGKRTQSAMLREALQKRLIMSRLIDFPTKGTPTGDAVSAYLKHLSHAGRPHYLERHAMPCLAAADLWAAAPRIESACNMFDVLVLNRSPASNIAYGRAAGLGPEPWLRGLTRGHPAEAPEFTVLLDIPVPESFRRQPKNRDASESDPGVLRRARAAYLSEARRHNWTVIRADRPAADVHRTILRRLLPGIRKALRRREEAMRAL